MTKTLSGHETTLVTFQPRLYQVSLQPNRCVAEVYAGSHAEAASIIGRRVLRASREKSVEINTKLPRHSWHSMSVNREGTVTARCGRDRPLPYLVAPAKAKPADLDACGLSLLHLADEQGVA